MCLKAAHEQFYHPEVRYFDEDSAHTVGNYFWKEDSSCAIVVYLRMRLAISSRHLPIPEIQWLNCK